MKQYQKRGSYLYFESFEEIDRILRKSRDIKVKNLEFREIKEMEDKSGSYVGQWNIISGKREGMGVFFWQNGSLYEGYWRSGEASGRGRMLHDNGDVYEGEW